MKTINEMKTDTEIDLIITALINEHEVNNKTQ